MVYIYKTIHILGRQRF